MEGMEKTQRGLRWKVQFLFAVHQGRIMAEDKCILLGVVGDPEGAGASGICRVLCMTLWEREEDLTQDTVPLQEKGGLELRIHAAPPRIPSSLHVQRVSGRGGWH